MNELESGVPPLELCRQISGQLSELLNCPVVCKYDEPENLFYAQIFNVVFDRFDEVESKVSDYSNANYEQLGAFCIPVMFTPEQTRDWFPMYAESNRQGKRIAELEKEKSELLAKCEKYEYEIGLAKQQITALESKSNMYIDLAVAMASTARKVDGLEKERNRLQEALQVIASGHFSGRVELVNTEEMKTVWKSNVGLPMTVSEARDIARKALKGAGNVEKDS